MAGMSFGCTNPVYFSGATEFTYEDTVIGGYFPMVGPGGKGSYIRVRLEIHNDLGVQHTYRCAIYDSDKNLVTNGITEEKTFDTGNRAYGVNFGFVGTKPVLVSGQSYWLCVWCNNTAPENFQFSTLSQGTGIYASGLTYTGTFPSVLGFTTPVDGHSADLFCINCAYETPYLTTMNSGRLWFFGGSNKLNICEG